MIKREYNIKKIKSIAKIYLLNNLLKLSNVIHKMKKIVFRETDTKIYGNRKRRGHG